MRWTIKHGDILDEPADVLVCSANVFLNLSGGVGGAMLLRYGDAMQKELHRYLAKQNRRFVQQGEVVMTPPSGSPYQAVLHAVAVDGFYQSSPEIVGSVVAKSLAMAAGMCAKRVALTALATGYGRLSMRQFAEGISSLISSEYPPIREIVVCVRNKSNLDELTDALPLGRS
jgi:O-acetyl-ADP-ribose deacetylase (regulator of RNase III)